MALLYLTPITVVIGLLLIRRASLLWAGVIGLLLTYGIAGLAYKGSEPALDFLIVESLQGAWISWQALSVIFAGLLFYQVIRQSQPASFPQQSIKRKSLTHRGLFFVCFLVGSFTESATGFGVGAVITLAALLKMGINGIAAIVLSLFSQTLVPWGALAIGTTVGAALIDAPLADFGARSAVICTPIVLAYLSVFWKYVRIAGAASSAHDKLEDVLWLNAVCVILYLINRYGSVDIAGVTATASVLLIHWLIHSRGAQADLATQLRRAAPYAALTGILLVTRLFPPLRETLRNVLVLQPFAGGSAFPILYHTSMIILAVALGYALWQRNVIRFNAVLSETAKTAYSPLLVTLVFVIMAQLTSTSGMAAEIAHAWEGIAHRYATLAAPLFAALSGALTGSNTASNSMMLPLQVAIANHTGVAADWVAALQNAVGSSFTLFSPSRIAMACSLVSIKVAEAAAYRAALPLGVIAAGVGFTAVVMLLLVS